MIRWIALRNQRRDKIHAKAFHCTKEQRRLTIVLLITALPDCWGGVRLRLCHCTTVEPRPSWLRRTIALVGSNAIARRFAWHLLWKKNLLVVLVSFRLVFLATFKIYYVDFWLWNYLDFWTLNYVVFGTSKFCPFIWVYRYCIYFWITRTLIFHHVVPNLHFVTYFWYCHCHLLMLINYCNWNKLFHTRLCWKLHSGHSFRSWK